MKKYSLANYILSIEPKDQILKTMFGTISIGGQGKYIGSIKLGLNSDLWNTKGFSTGAWVHEKNLDKTGICTITLHQLADEVITFIKFCNIYYSGDYDGVDISLTDSKGNRIATGEDCYPKKLADQEFSEESGNQDWQLTCGKISFQ